MRRLSLVGSTAALLLALLPGAFGQELCEPRFRAGSVFNVGGNLGTSALVDLNADGDLDLIIGLTFFLGDGSGRFPRQHRLASPSPTFPEAFDVKAADFDDDGNLDLAMVTFGGDEVVFFWGRGPTSQPAVIFGPPTVLDVRQHSTAVWHIDVADFNGDSLPDIVGINFGFPRILILLNNGRRRFTASSIAQETDINHMLTTGDFNGDGKMDVAVGRGPEVEFLFGRGNGTFTRSNTSIMYQSSSTVSGHRFRSADVDGDGKSDLFATANRWILVYFGSEIDQLRGVPRAASRTLTASGGTGGTPGVRFIELVDMNQDGSLDVTSVAETPRGAVYQVFLGSVRNNRLTYDATGAVMTQLSGRGSVLAVGDINNDTAPDLALTTEDTGKGQTFIGDGRCRPPEKRLGDVNDDGRLDITDPTVILLHLFKAFELPCPAAADVNDDDKIELSDAVYVLDYLFRAGPAPRGTAPRVCVEN